MRKIKESFFSVVLPYFNREDFLHQSISSVLNQEYRKFELICVNDGSTDDSEKIVEYYAAKDDRIITINQENKGRCAARNVGINMANSQWICFLDSDDKFYPNHLQALHNLILQYPNSSCFATEQIYKGKIRPTGGKMFNDTNSIIKFEDSIKGNPIQLNQLCFNKKINCHFINQNIPISEDWLFIRELLLKTDIIKTNVITNELVEHNKRSMNSSISIEIAMWNKYTAEYFVNNNDLKDEIKNQLLLNTYLLCANIVLSNKNNTEGLIYIRKSLIYRHVFFNALFYKGLIKICLNLLH